jgi:ribosome-associated translation inhibitor RaiA
MIRFYGGLDMHSTNFHVDFVSDVPDFDNLFRIAAETRLRQLAVHHNEIDHATIVVTKGKENEEVAQYQARVTVYAPTGDMAVTKSDYRLVEALDKALADIERQIHERY